MYRRINYLALAAALVLVGLVCWAATDALAQDRVTATAAAARCSIGDDGISYNRAGVEARFRSLQARRGMTCSSARYVLNRWLRRAYERRWSESLPTRVYDGYVTWYCGRTSRLRWQCDEYESGTQFRFTAYTV